MRSGEHDILKNMKLKKVIDQSVYTFPKWTTKNIQQVPEKSALELRERVESIVVIDKEQRTFENTAFALEALSYGIGHNVLLLHILMNLSPKEDIRKASQKAEQEYEKRLIEIVYDQKLYKAFRDYYLGNYKQEKKSLLPSEVKFVEDTFKEYKNLGFELDSKDQKKIKTLLKKQAILASKFRFNINATDTHILCTADELEGLPEKPVEALPKDKHTGKYVVQAEGSIYTTFMKFAVNSRKRKELATLSLQKGGRKNIEILTELTQLRKETAELLGYKNHIEKTLTSRMAKSEKNAKEFIEKMYRRVESKALKEKKVLNELKSKDIGAKSNAEFYDINYYSNKLYERTAALDSDALKDYFECENTTKEMLKLYGELFGIDFSYTKELPVWDKSVQVLKLNDKKTKEVLGYIYMDLHPRKGKYGHAMVTHATNGYQKGWRKGDYMMPICALVCNFSVPTKKSPSLLSLRDVETLFHEFGHALHTVLTKAAFESQSGTNVTWDFVEAPSQMLENFLYEEKHLKNISRHYTTGKPLDSLTIKKIIANKNFMMATHISRQLLFCFFDFEIHGTNRPKDIVRTYNNLYTKITGNKLPKETYFPAGFGHMDGYDAGYYSYMWALVYAQDIYSRFKKAKNNKELIKVGMDYRTKILEVGSTRGELESAIDFLGRKPNTKAFFQSQGI